MIKLLHIENTSVCNASCPMCTRNVNGKELSSNFTIGSLEFDKFKSVVLPHIETLEKIMFCGTLGDPCADNNLLDKIKWIKEIKPECVVGLNTNGSIQNKNWWAQIAQLLSGIYDYVVFSIDGLEDTNHIYRVGVRWNKVMENAKAYIDAGGIAHWDMLVFDHNKHQIQECMMMASDLGFSWFRTKETDRWNEYKFDNLLPAEDYEQIDYSNIEEVICERDREESLYIDYTGQSWPCCYMASINYGEIDRSKNKDMLTYSPDILMAEYQNRLKDKRPFYVCKRSCGTAVNKRSQWKTEVQIK